MILVICAGGTICMENPQNSLVAMQNRFVWLVKLLERANIPVPCLYAVLYQLVVLLNHTDFEYARLTLVHTN